MKNLLTILIILLSILSCSDQINSEYNLLNDCTATIEVISDTQVNINAWVYDGNNAFYNDALITVDNLILENHSGNNYYVYENAEWAEGSSYSYSIEIPDKGSSSGEIIKPSGVLAGVTYSPDKSSALAESYTVSPPSGEWPEGSYIECYVVNDDINYLYTSDPQGSDSVLFDGEKLAGATSIFFSTAIKNTEELSDFGDYSVIEIIGPKTTW